MAKWGFDDNVPKVKPRLRLGRQGDATVTVDTVTEPPSPRPHAEDETAAAPEPRRRSMVRDLIAAADENAAAIEGLQQVQDEPLVDTEARIATAPEPEPVVEAAPEPVVEAAPEPVVEAAPEPVVEAAPEPVVEAAPEPVVEAAPEPVVEAAPEPVVEAAPEPEPEPVVEAVPEPEPVVAAVSEPEPIVEAPPVVEAIPTPAPVVEAVPEPVVEEAKPVPVAVAETPIVEPEPVVAPRAAVVTPDADAALRRSSLRRRAAGLSALPVPEPSAPAATAQSLLEDLDALEDAAELAVELERALTEAAEANERLRKDLGAALDDLARSTAENRRLSERVDRLEVEARDRSRVVQDLVAELELLEGERDAAIGQSSDASMEIDAVEEKLMLAERRMAELERALSDAHARTRRFEEAAQTHAAQRAALRAEVESLRRERDGLLTRTAELEREGEELGRSRKALDEVHRALAEARNRAQRIRTR